MFCLAKISQSEFSFQMWLPLLINLIIENNMILVVDVAYKDNSAQVAGVLLESWESCISTNQYIIHIQNIAEYESGQFYKRELPCILALLDVVKEKIEFIVVGWVCLFRCRTVSLIRSAFI